MTERMVEVLRTLANHHPRTMTPNELGYSLGFRPARSKGGLGSGRGGGAGTGVAQRVNFSIIALRKLGFVDFGWREDNLTGTAYRITDAGKTHLAMRGVAAGR